MIKVLLVDDHAVFREGLKRVFEAAGDLVVIGEAATGEEALRLAKASAPDVVVLDVAMPGRGGLETAQDLKRLLPRVRILMLSALAEDHFAMRFLKEGAPLPPSGASSKSRLPRGPHRRYLRELADRVDFGGMTRRRFRAGGKLRRNWIEDTDRHSSSFFGVPASPPRSGAF